MSRPCFLYRLYGDHDVLLYVGISVSALGRLGEHLTEKSWAVDVRRTTIEAYDDRAAAAAAEVAAIKAERPLHNVVHNTRRVPTQQGRNVDGDRGRRLVANEWFGPAPTAESMPDMCHDYCVKEAWQRGEHDDHIYLPYKWVKGRAFYVCRAGHRWTCGWGHQASGKNPDACDHYWYEPNLRGDMECCDCDAVLSGLGSRVRT